MAVDVRLKEIRLPLLILRNRGLDHTHGQGPFHGKSLLHARVTERESDGEQNGRAGETDASLEGGAIEKEMREGG